MIDFSKAREHDRKVEEKRLRDYFAAKAMHAIMTDPKPLLYYEIARHAYRVADEMMKAREL